MMKLTNRWVLRRAISTMTANLQKQNKPMAIVSIEQGKLRGKSETLSSGSVFTSFKGIPYAKPPVGELRFHAPQPPEKWDGLRDATEHGPCCPHWRIELGMAFEGSEDCLSLNVYTPNVNGPPKPVMIWFHGGGFQSGSADSDQYGPDYLVEEGVVLVTVNYRLEIFGYLCMDTKEVPGNAGMKDQVLAMRWVQKNIAAFGGDPGNVTIFGESAGAASVSYHLISPMSQGLFHKIISQSGVFLNEWALTSNSFNRAFRLGRYLGKNSQDFGLLLKYLKSLPSSKFIRAQHEIAIPEEIYRGLAIYFAPVIEKTFEGQESFLPKSPLELLKEGNFSKVPILLGYNNKEGISGVRQTLRKAEVFNEDLTSWVPKDIANQVSPMLLKDISEKLREFYFKDKPIGPDTRDSVINVVSDYLFTYGIISFIENMTDLYSSPIFMYRFSADTELNYMKGIHKGLEIEGASHADDLFYLFKTPIEIEEESAGWRTMKRMTRMWTNFSKYGNPTPVMDELIPVIWKPVTPTVFNFLDIGLELKPGTDPEKERYEFWKRLYNDLSIGKHAKSHL